MVSFQNVSSLVTVDDHCTNCYSTLLKLLTLYIHFEYSTQLTIRFACSWCYLSSQEPEDQAQYLIYTGN